MNEFFSFLNPKMIYDIQHHIYYEQLSQMESFKFADLTEIMFIANHMNAKLYISGEEIIQQGDEANEMFIIFRGGVLVKIFDQYSRNNS